MTNPFDPVSSYEELPPSHTFSGDPLHELPLLSYGGLPKPQRKHPFSEVFAPPEWSPILIHAAFCLLSLPVLLAAASLAQERSLFWTRTIVSAASGAVGLALGFSLIELGRRFIEAAAWATLIHQSRIPSAPGMILNDFVAITEDRIYDRKPWTLFILFFIILVSLANGISFILGRIISIETMNIKHEYSEILVKGALSEDDISKAGALAQTFNTFSLTWTLSPFSSHASLPAAIAFAWKNDTIYFSETSSGQLAPNGTGFGIFNANTTGPAIQQDNARPSVTRTAGSDQPGAMLRYPRWGIRINCQKIASNGNANIIPKSATGLTYIFTPRDILRSLFSSFAMDFPAILEPAINISSAMQPGDVFPADLDPSDYSLSAFFSDNGVAHSFKSVPLTMGSEGFGWVSIESVLVRLNTSYTPNGIFSLLSSQALPTGDGICLQLYEPYVLETFIGDGSPYSTSIASKGKSIVDIDPGEKNTNGPRLGVPIMQRELNSTGLAGVFDTLHGNSINQILKDNGRDAFYVPSPTVVSYTDGQGPAGYTELSPVFFAEARALSDATNATVVARSFPYKSLASALIDIPQMTAFLAGVLVLGLLAGLFVPQLPLQIPHRGFDLYSWLAVLGSEEVVGEHDLPLPKRMSLRDVRTAPGEYSTQIPLIIGSLGIFLYSSVKLA
ncbi:hypothetical protein C8J56DRAFT_1003458 [Mycena floridula]|nr:hypothetical protein C8J56DRAFT_1003458 [Mycena floridula]